MQKITSTSNERIKRLKTLRTKKGREQYGAYLLEGKRAVLDAIENGAELELVLLSCEYDVPVDLKCEVISVSQNVIEALSETSSPEGIIAVAKIFNTPFEPEKLNGIVVFLDHLQDAGNLGTIIRTADAAGIDAVILSPECVDLFNPKVVRSTMSSLFNVRIMKAENSVQALRALKERGYSICAAALGGEDFYSASFCEKTCVVIGNEGNGITQEVLSEADKKVMLPMQGKAESLNAAIAAGILIYGIKFGK